MLFERKAVQDLQRWYHSPNRKPLVIRGARQVGKTTAVEMAARDLDVPIYRVNLERHTSLEGQFSRYEIQRLLFSFSTICGASITAQSPGILFLDEAQATPSAYACLRYFYEDVPKLAVILTGSLLDQVLADYRRSAPVGRVEHYFMGPVDFNEFLAASRQPKLLNTVNSIKLETLGAIPDEIHQQLLEQVRRYILVGGMPHAVQLAIDAHFDHASVNKDQVELIQTYKADFSKYRGSIDALKLNTFFDGVLAQVGEQFSHKVARQIVDGSGGDNRLLNSAIEQFIEARLFYRVLHSSADKIPLGAQTKSRISKFLFVDVGLLLAAQNMPVQTVIGKPLELANRGIVAEQFVGQHLLYAGPSFKTPELYYWSPPKNEGQAEVDFLLQHGRDIVPVEVKSGPVGRLKSLHSYAFRKNAVLGVRIHSGKGGLENIEIREQRQARPLKLLNLPFYLIGSVQRLIEESI